MAKRRTIFAVSVQICFLVSWGYIEASPKDPLGANWAATDSLPNLDRSARDEIRNYANTLFTMAGGARALTDAELDGFATSNGFSWWEVVGSVMVAEEIAWQLRHENYQGALEVAAEYSAQGILLRSSVLQSLGGAHAIGQIAALPISSQLSWYSQHMENAAVRCQLELYFMARTEPHQLSHRQIIGGKEVVRFV